MKSNFRILVLLVALLSLPLAVFGTPPATPATTEGFGLPQIVGLINMGVDEPSVIAAIRGAEKVSFDTSAAGLVAMKQAGLSDKVVAAILQRASTPVVAAVFGPSVSQNGKTFNVGTAGVVNRFLPGKGNALQVLAEIGPTSLVTAAATGLLIGSAPAGLGVLGGGLIGAIPYGVSALNMARGKTKQGFEYELLPGASSTNPLASAEATFQIPFSTLDDNRYRVAEPGLYRLVPDAKTDARVLGTAEGKVKVNSSGQVTKKTLEPFKRESVAAEVAKAEAGVTLKTANLAPGEYAIGFVYDGKLLPQVMDFTVR